MNLNIVYEDKDIIVIDKPAGIAVHSADTKSSRYPTIVGYLEEYYPAIRHVGENSLRPGVVHRLDKETSGVMVVVKNNETFFELKKQFQERKIKKKYIALISGILEKDSGAIKIPLRKLGTRTSTRSGPASPTLGGPGTRDAVTEYKVLKRYEDYTLMEVSPKTGRQHQIRVHFAAINHPVACDKLYGRKAKKCPAGLNRHFLHASYLSFRLKNALMEFESELPQDLTAALDTLS